MRRPRQYKLTGFKTRKDLRATPVTIQFECIYLRNGVCPGWRNERVERLLKLLGCSIHELMAMCAEFDFDLAGRAIEQNRWPSSLSLHFSIIEAAALVQKEGRLKHRPRKIVRPEFLKICPHDNSQSKPLTTTKADS